MAPARARSGTKKPLPDVLKLSLRFHAMRLQTDVARLGTDQFIPHFNTAYYQGDWSAIPLRSIG